MRANGVARLPGAPARSNRSEGRFRPGNGQRGIGVLSLVEEIGADGRDEYVQRVLTKLDAIYDDLEANVLKIWGRRDVLLSLDLAYHSMLQFAHRGQLVPRGWVEVLIPGDAGTGKSTLAERLLAHYRAGELRTGEAMSVAGLVGGVDKVGERNVMKWGILPRCDGRLLIIDEAHAMHPDVLGALTNVRSSGFAEISKIVQMRTRARVRKVWICNPTGWHTSILSYGFGVLAVRDAIKRPEDIRRFDLACLAAEGDLRRGDIDAREEAPAPPHVHTSALCNALVRWAWSRTPGQVVVSRSSERVARTIGRELSERYSHEIPLIMEAEAALKLLRIGAAIAARVFNADPPGERLIVEPEHVRAAGAFVRYCYDKPTCSFDAWSRPRIANPDAVRARLRPHGKKFLRALHVHQQVPKTLFDDLLVDKDTAHSLHRFLLLNGALQRGAKSTTKANEFVTLLNDMLLDPTIPEEPVPGGPPPDSEE